MPWRRTTSESRDCILFITSTRGFIRRTYFFFQAEDGIRDLTVTGVQTCALPIFAAQKADETRKVSLVGGGSGIRTHGTLSRTHAFQACALSHSAIPPAPLSCDGGRDRKSVV